MADRVTPADEDVKTESVLLMCEHCGSLRPAQRTDKGLVPYNTAAGGECRHCGGDEFEQVIL